MVYTRKVKGRDLTLDTKLTMNVQKTMQTINNNGTDGRIAVKQVVVGKILGLNPRSINYGDQSSSKER